MCLQEPELSAPSFHSDLSPEMYLNYKFGSDMPRFLNSWFVEVRVQCLTSAAMLEFCTWVSSLPCCMCHHRVPVRPLCLPLDSPLHQQQILFTLTHNFRKQSQSWHSRSSHEPSHCKQRTGLGPLDEIEWPQVCGISWHESWGNWLVYLPNLSPSPSCHGDQSHWGMEKKGKHHSYF